VSADLIRRLADIGRPNILVVGDLILDRYVWGSVQRISPEAPIPVLKVTAEDVRLGGAGCVASNLANLGAEVSLVGAVGADAEADILRQRMAELEIDAAAVLEHPDRHTTVKTRYLARVQQVLRVDREEAAPFSDNLAETLLEKLQDKIAEADIVLLSDYNKGLLTPKIIEGVVGAAQKAGKRVLADPARGVDGARYRGVSAVCPNRTEAAEAVGLTDGATDVDKVGRRLLRRLDLEAAIVTRDRDGISLYQPRKKALHVPAQAREVFDVTGAGDMVLSILGLVLAGGGSYEEAVRIANVAGSLEVSKLGVVPLSRDEIIAELEQPGHGVASKLRNRDELATLCRGLQGKGRTVVFTNGCFDLLNANHIALLRHAKSLGDVLIVATNTDASIRRLKGPQRPILGQDERVELLSAVHHVDHVVVYPEDTPRPLLRLLKPDILVKGGDYEDKTQAVGWEIVEEYGGRVEMAPLTDYNSTSQIIDKVMGEGHQ
jgi:D-beta-D-heptose 7-phosphate kinase/D-beta-D-heptose 1-phosphate adenosyltransferase